MIYIAFYPMPHWTHYNLEGSMPASLSDARAASTSWLTVTSPLRLASTSVLSRQPALFLRKKMAAEVLGLAASVAELNN